MPDINLQVTDPARELADLLTKLTVFSGNEIGQDLLARLFDVKPWSLDFFNINYAIMERIDLIKNLVNMLDIDNDLKIEIIQNLDETALAFSMESFNRSWSDFGARKISKHNILSIKTLSGQIRPQVCYRKIDDADIEDLKIMVFGLIKELEEIQLNEKDFIRQELIDGLKRFHFKLDKFEWLGYGYVIESLKEVIGAYLVLEKGFPDPEVNSDVDKIFSSVKYFFNASMEKISIARDVADNVDLILRLYGGLSILALAAVPAVKYLPDLR